MTSPPTRSHDQVIKSGNRGDIQLGTATTSSSYGYVFNVQTKPSSGVILINGLDFYTESTNELSFELWTKVGPYEDAKGTYDGWDLIASGFVKGNGVGKYTSIPTELLTPVSVNGSGGVRSFYFSLKSLDLMCKVSNRGTTGENKLYAETPDIKLFEGEGVMFYPFPDPSQDYLYRSQRQLLGRIYYDRMPCKPYSEFGKVDELPCPGAPTGEPTYLSTSNAPSVSPTVPFPTVSPETSPSINPTTSTIPTSPPSTLQPTSSPINTFDTYFIVSMTNVPGRSMNNDEVDFFVSSILSFLNKATNNAAIAVDSIDFWQQELVSGVKNIAKNGRSLRGTVKPRQLQSQQLTSLKVTLAVRVSSATMSVSEAGNAISALLAENQQELVGILKEEKSFEYFVNLEDFTAQSIQSLPPLPSASDDVSSPTRDREKTTSEVVIPTAEEQSKGGRQTGIYAGICVGVLVGFLTIAFFLVKRRRASKKNIYVATTSTHKGRFSFEDSDENEPALPLSDVNVYETAVCESVSIVESWHENQLSGSLILLDGQKIKPIGTVEAHPIGVFDDSVITIDQEWMDDSDLTADQNMQTFAAVDVVSEADGNESDTSTSSSSSSSSSSTSSSDDQINYYQERSRAVRVVPNTRTFKKSLSSREFDSSKQSRKAASADEVAEEGRGLAPRRLSQSMVVNMSDDIFAAVIRSSDHGDNETDDVELSKGLVQTVKPISTKKSKGSSKQPSQSSEQLIVDKVSALNRSEHQDSLKSSKARRIPQESLRTRQEALNEWSEEVTGASKERKNRRRRRDKLSSSNANVRATTAKTDKGKESQSLIMLKSDFSEGIDSSLRSASIERYGERQLTKIDKKNRRSNQTNIVSSGNMTDNVREKTSSRKKRDNLSSSDTKIKTSKSSSGTQRVSQSVILSKSDVSNLLDTKPTTSEHVRDLRGSKTKAKKDTLRRSTSSEHCRRPSTSFINESKSRQKKKISHRSRSLIVESDQKAKQHKRHNSQNDILPVESDKLNRLGSNMSGRSDGLRRSKKKKRQSSMTRSTSRNRGKLAIGKTEDDDRLRGSLLSQDGSNKLEGLKRSDSMKKLRKSSLSDDANNYPRVMKRSSMDHTAIRKKKYSQGRATMSQSMTTPRSEFR